MAFSGTHRPPKLKTSYKIQRALTPLHTGGPIALTPSGGHIITLLGPEARLTSVHTGSVGCTFQGDSSGITALCLSPSGRHLCVFYQSLALRIYELPPLALPLAQGSGSGSSPPPVPPLRQIARSHDAPVHTCTVDRTSTLLASGSADGVVKVWDILQGYVTHVFRGHGGVVSALRFNMPFVDAMGAKRGDGDGYGAGRVRQLVTGSVDSRVRVWELDPSPDEGEGGAGKKHQLLEGHVSAVRGLDVSADGKWLVSGGRDGVLLIWDISGTQTSQKKGKGKGKKAELAKTIPLGGSCEAAGIVRSEEDVRGAGRGKDVGGRLRLWAAVAGGGLSVWDASEGKKLLVLGSVAAGEEREIVDALYLPAIGSLVSVHADQNILFHSIATGLPTQQLVGYNDSIVDAVFLSPLAPSTGMPEPADPTTEDTHLAIATNSSLIRVYNTATNDARLLPGHGDMVLSLAGSSGGKILASGGKDRSARLWALCPPPAESQETQGAEWRCVGICDGHAESVGAVVLSRLPPSQDLGFLITGSQDRTIKLWDLSALLPQADGTWPSEPSRPKSLTTLKAHEKDINALDIAPNDKLLASASQDKTVKVYEIDYTAKVRNGQHAEGDLKLLGTCRGHKRGVWTVRFGRNDRVLASGSGDKTIRLWSLQDFSCLKTFEGHTNSVLRVDFLSAGMQLVSAASDGLVKLWNVKEEECVTSLDNHDDRIWALAVSKDESTIVSAGADSVITFWHDSTEEEAIAAEESRIAEVAHEQDFLNYVSLKDYRSAILLALSMNQPKRLLNLVTTINAARAPGKKSITGSPEVDQVIKTLGQADLVSLLKHVRNWNATARTSPIAQLILHAVFKLHTAEDITNAFSSQKNDKPEMNIDGEEDVQKRKTDVSLKELIDGLLPYTERHYARAERLVQDSYVVDHVLGQMHDWLLDDGDVAMA